MHHLLWTKQILFISLYVITMFWGLKIKVTRGKENEVPTSSVALVEMRNLLLAYFKNLGNAYVATSDQAQILEYITKLLWWEDGQKITLDEEASREFIVAFSAFMEGQGFGIEQILSHIQVLVNYKLISPIPLTHNHIDNLKALLSNSEVIKDPALRATLLALFATNDIDGMYKVQELEDARNQIITKFPNAPESFIDLYEKFQSDNNTGYCRMLNKFKFKVNRFGVIELHHPALDFAVMAQDLYTNIGYVAFDNIRVDSYYTRKFGSLSDWEKLTTTIPGNSPQAKADNFRAIFDMAEGISEPSGLASADYWTNEKNHIVPIWFNIDGNSDDDALLSPVAANTNTRWSSVRLFRTVKN